jgi:hypothetical protein
LKSIQRRVPPPPSTLTSAPSIEHLVLLAMQHATRATLQGAVTQLASASNVRDPVCARLRRPHGRLRPTPPREFLRAPGCVAAAYQHCRTTRTRRQQLRPMVESALVSSVDSIERCGRSALSGASTIHPCVNGRWDCVNGRFALYRRGAPMRRSPRPLGVAKRDGLPVRVHR